MTAEAAVVAAARDGDEAAFRTLTEPYARELHVHCYRMLGSIQDAEDALQETLLRAWRHIAGFEPRGPFRAWLYKIATNVCLSAASRGSSESIPYPTNAEGEALVRTPYPDAWLDELRSEPAVRYDLHESVQIAFLAAIQVLPPRQRAVLLLRDVLGFPANEVAELIGSTTAGVNSALQRARAGLDRWRAEGRLDIGRASAPDDVQQSLVRRYVEAWEAVDVDGLVALLREDAVMTMPPSPLLFHGRQAIGEFFATVPAEGALDQIRLVPTRANGQPALAAYLLDREAGVHFGYGLMVLTVDGEEIAEITGFTDPALFSLFGLPEEFRAG
jgi:RNA polymerase sigma-70 factor, ECF subfamily